MKFRRIISILLACVLVCAMFTSNVFAATNEEYIYVNDYADTNTVSHYKLRALAGYCSTNAITHSSITYTSSMPDSSIIKCQSVVFVYYTDGSFDGDSDFSDELTVSNLGDNVQAYAGYYYDTYKGVDHFSFQHYFLINGVCVKRDTKTENYGIDNF